MKDLLHGYGIEVVALSRDSVEEARAMKARDGLGFTLLSDPDLSVIEQYGVLHLRGLPFHTFVVLGVPFGAPRLREKMAIPTTLLVDEQGIVRWLDQATDYRMRGDRERIEAALREAFPADEALGPRPEQQ